MLRALPLLLLLGACATTAPERPASPVAPPTAWRTTPNAQGALAADWTRFMRDPPATVRAY